MVFEKVSANISSTFNNVVSAYDISSCLSLIPLATYANSSNLVYFQITNHIINKSVICYLCLSSPIPSFDDLTVLFDAPLFYDCPEKIDISFYAPCAYADRLCLSLKHDYSKLARKHGRNACLKFLVEAVCFYLLY
ncbi:hypothetical protein [Dipodfec virus UOA04_Rod_707]|nr:hypothetical protein [Dipodfec virus UOA04_Rod_707]